MNAPYVVETMGACCADCAESSSPRGLAGIRDWANVLFPVPMLVAGLATGATDPLEVVHPHIAPAGWGEWVRPAFVGVTGLAIVAAGYAVVRGLRSRSSRSKRSKRLKGKSR